MPRHVRPSLGALLLLGLVFFDRSAQATTEPPSARAPAVATPVVSYRLEATLDPERHEIRGRGRIALRNTTPRALSELRFQLYLNAFSGKHSSFYRDPFVRARGGGWPRTWGGVEITSLRVGDSTQEIWPGAVGLDSENPEDRTSVTLPLPEPIPRGAQRDLHIEWTSKLPDLVERTGYRRDFHFVGQWYPKLAKLEPDGSWRDFPFHPYGEFYANFGDYDVTLDVPSAFVVGATGALRDSTDDGERTRHHYHAARVHDFAWTAWPDFRQREERIGETAVRVLFPPGHERNAERILLALRHGLADMGRDYGAYPYPTLTVVHPPDFAAPAGGMEYPTLFTTDGKWFLGFLSRRVEQVTLHELAHQWFGGMLGSDESSWPFLDEGLASYADARSGQALFGESSGALLPGLPISVHAGYRVLGLLHGQDVPIAIAARAFPSFGHLGSVVYGRTATVLETWGRVHGEPFRRALREYAWAHRFDHPTPDDLLTQIHAHAGDATAEQLRTALFERGWVDFAVTRLQSRTTASGEHRARAVVVRRGDLVLPVEIELVDAAGQRELRHWDGGGAWHAVEYSGAVPLRSVVVDPERRVLLDQDLTNNARSVQPRRDWRVLSWLALAFELLLHGLGP